MSGTPLCRALETGLSEREATENPPHVETPNLIYNWQPPLPPSKKVRRCYECVKSLASVGGSQVNCRYCLKNRRREAKLPVPVPVATCPSAPPSLEPPPVSNNMPPSRGPFSNSACTMTPAHQLAHADERRFAWPLLSIPLQLRTVVSH